MLEVSGGQRAAGSIWIQDNGTSFFQPYPGYGRRGEELRSG